jgi:hypothetical protein
MARHTLRPRVRAGGVAILAATLSACGGGGGGGGGSSGGGGPSPSNPPPTLSATQFSTKEDTSLSAQVTATDPTGEALTFATTGNPTHGTLTSFSANGSFVYQPAPGMTGADAFGIRVTDSGGNQVTGSVTITVNPNRPPIAANDVMRAEGTALDAINVLKNDSDPDGDKLTVSIEAAPLVGSATVNADSTVRLTGLSGFKGVTRFSYRITDTDGASSVATAAIFVGTDPFRVFFAQDVSGSGPEVFVNDLAADPRAVTKATEGTLRLEGFQVSDNGATVVYRREDSAAPTTTDLSFLQTTGSNPATKIALPSGATLAQDSQDGTDQFRVSPDGKWIALIARVSNADAVYLLDVSSPSTLTKVSPAGTLSAARLKFSGNSQNLYFLASGAANGANKSLYTVATASPGTAAPVSALSSPNTADDVGDYAVSPDQARVLLQANRGGRVGLYFVDARQLQTEVQVSQALGYGDVISNSTLSLNGGTVSAAPLQRVSYTVKALDGTTSTYVAEVSATPNPRVVPNATQAIGLRPDDGGLLYAKGTSQIWENIIGGSTSDQLIEAGTNAWYDSTGNIVLVRQLLPYPALAVTSRGSFGTSKPLGTPGLAAHYVNVSGFDRGVVVIGEGPTTGTPPTSPRPALVNALAPDKLFYLSASGSPQQLTSPSARVVGAP